MSLIQEALREVRLVTLVGPGGVGKSRTALRAAEGLRERFPDGVWLAELSALSDPELVPATLATVLGVPDQMGMEPLDAVVAHLKGQQLLIVLDTCEHMVDACAVLCDVLLREAAEVCVLATSRQPLDVADERTMPIAPLGVDDAVELFTQRAARVLPGWTITEANRTQTLALVERLDRIPLALELAAVRLRVAPLAELVARLDRRFEVFTGGQRAACARHQTLRTTIGWSHELCTPAERLLWARLSVFAGSFELSAAERVGGDDGLPSDAVLEALFGLVDKSVVQRVGEDGSRYRFLDTIREYGAERLDEESDAAAVRGRHFEYHRDTAGRLWAELITPAQAELHRAVRGQIADTRAAMKYAFTVPDRAVEGLGYAEGARQLSGDPVAMLASLLDQQEATRNALREALGDMEYERWHGVGARLSGTEILHAVRADTDSPLTTGRLPRSRQGSTPADVLTPREREVATLVASGLSNREVAEQLVISKRTADTHVERILTKLAIDSRTEIASVLSP
ncbi:LuxR C-terminal-related transcriptional regulator [Streptomyces sp. NPDC057575]|uniref:LuxR C-terminal-related transcriptional regulator n=1 Tax=unclassified Streptomyces TaxID=2593676 RepID=UPI0036B19912